MTPRYTIILTLLIAIGSFYAPPAFAQETLSEVEPFSFGRFSLADNSLAHDLSIDGATNMASAASAFIIDTPAQRGEYRLEGFTPGTEVTVTVSNGGLTLNGGGGVATFATINYTVSPQPVIIGGSGSAIFYVGATLRTLGDGVTYPTGTYKDDIDIQFDWVP